MRILLLSAVLLVISCSQNKSGGNNYKVYKNSNIFENQMIVKGDLKQIESELQKMNVNFDIMYSDSNDVYHLNLNTKSMEELTATIGQINSLSSVEFAEANLQVTKNSVGTKDPLFLDQWALNNIGQDNPASIRGTIGADLGALKAWEITKGSKEIIVAVIDTGIDYLHPDLRSNMWVNKKELEGVAGVDDDGNGYADDVYGWNFITMGRTEPYYGQLGHPDPMDDNSHGSHCAGIIGASANNFVGISGINHHVSLMALKFLDKDGSGSTMDAYRAIRYAIVNKVDVMSNSWGGGGYSKVMDYGVKLANEAGILFVAAAGNDESNNDYTDSFPANIKQPNVISVAASDNKDQLAYFSNYGSKNVHIAAPGVAIMSTIPRSKAKNDTGAYASFSGTSMATPYVAGAAALVLSHVTNLKKNPIELKNILLSTVDILPQLNGKVSSRGRINVYRALSADKNVIVKDSEVITEDLEINSPRYNTEVFDKVWKISKEGAKKIRLNFSNVMLDHGYDLISIYDKNNVKVYNFEEDFPMGMNSPWIEGDTVYVRMANALVLMKVPVDKIYNTPGEGFNDGAFACSTLPDGKYECTSFKSSKPYANFDSEGFTINSFDYTL